MELKVEEQIVLEGGYYYNLENETEWINLNCIKGNNYMKNINNNILLTIYVYMMDVNE